MKLAFFGGIYNNYLALEAAIADARGRGVERMFCLGDLGAFGPHPDRVFPLLHDNDVACIQGNYDHSIGNELNDCQCGYTDPRDNHFAQISYEYTYENTSRENREWMKALPAELRFETCGIRFLLCHGSPRRTNEFLWESTTSTAFLNKLADDYCADVILGTHTGIHWERELSGGRHSRNLPAAASNHAETDSEVDSLPAAPTDRPRRFINVGCLGRPENDGTTNVWYAVVRTGEDAVGSNVQSPVSSMARAVSCQPSACSVEFVPVYYDREYLACEMRDEKLPEEFIETILTGWWTTCLEVLPAKERRRGKF